jgi:hypothetical protein
MDSYQGRYSLPACMHATSSTALHSTEIHQHGHEIVRALRGSISEKAGLECELELVKHCVIIRVIEFRIP